MASTKTRFFDMHYEDYFIHSRLRENPDLFYRARILALSIFTLLANSGSMLFMLMFLSAFNNFRSVLLPTNIGCFVALSYALYRLKKDGNYAICCFITIAQSFANIALPTLLTGGPINSPAMQVMVIPCIVAFFFGGLRWGIVTTLLTGTFIIITQAAALAGFAFPQLAPAIFDNDIRNVAFLINFGMIAALSLFYETTSSGIKLERDIQHEKYIQMAKTDALTGLPNRRIFNETLSDRIALYNTMQPSRRFVLCYIDLDRFKPINDQHGHVVGDEVLKVVSSRLRSALRGADFIGRHGGDEFLLLLDEVSEPQAIAALAERFLHLLQAPIATEAGSVSVGSSMGFAIYPDHGRDRAGLEKAADAAMYEAKHNQLGWNIFDPPQLSCGLQ